MNLIRAIINFIFSKSEIDDRRYMIRILGFKIKRLKRSYRTRKKQSPYYYYKKHNIDIRTIPPTEGELREIQLAGCYLLSELDYVCKKNNLQYWIDFGCLLGAYRHKGFVPWDDDIDVGMFRDDIEKLFEVFENTTRDKDLYLNYVIKRSKRGVFVRLCHKKAPHVSMDIFHYDHCGEINPREKHYEKTITMKEERRNFVDNLKYTDAIDFFKKFEKLRNKYKAKQYLENSDIMWSVEFGHTWPKWIHSYETFFPLKEIEFEGKNFPCINNIERYLEDVYGDFMSYPKKLGMGHTMFEAHSDEEMEIIRDLKEKYLKSI